jgi:hypothetical protein
LLLLTLLLLLCVLLTLLECGAVADVAFFVDRKEESYWLA